MGHSVRRPQVGVNGCVLSYGTRIYIWFMSGDLNDFQDMRSL